MSESIAGSQETRRGEAVMSTAETWLSRDDVAQAVGRNIRAARIAAGLTIRRLSVLVDAGEADVSRWERGTNLIRPDMAIRVAVALDVTLDQLVAGTLPAGEGADG